jgi:hypothetical protein
VEFLVRVNVNCVLVIHCAQLVTFGTHANKIGKYLDTVISKFCSEITEASVHFNTIFTRG